MEDSWDSSEPGQAQFDPLLKCLMIIAKHHNKPLSAKAFTAGLPLVNNRLTPDLFSRAANRADLSAQIMKRSLNKISSVVLPAVLILKNHDACVLTQITPNGEAVIIQPEVDTGALTMPLISLENAYSGYVAYIFPTYHFSKRSEDILPPRPRDWFWNTILKVWPIYNEVLVASFLINLFALASPLFIMNVYDRVVPNHAIDTLWVLTIGVTIVFLFDFLLRNLRSYFIDIAGKNIDLRLSAAIFEQILGIKMAVRPSSVGAFSNTISSFEAFRDFLTSATVSVLVDIPFIVFYIITIMLIGGSLAWVPVLTIPIVLLIGFIIQIPLNRLVNESYRHAAEKQATLIETLGSVETIKSIGAESPLQRRWENLICNSAKVSVKIRMLSNLSINFSIFAQYLASIFIVIFGVYKITDGHLTTGALIACTILTGRALVPMSQVAGLITRYHQSITALKSITGIMNQPVDRPVGKAFLHRPKLFGEIEFRDVTFFYPGQLVAALAGVSFKIKVGERVGIIGRVGSGKSTVEKLLMGLYQPTTGTILIDGTEISQIDPADLRHNFGYVAQDPMLFYGSIKDNITMGAPYVEDSTILRAATIAAINRFISQHPQGFDLQVGERGEKLSGGQRQTIAIARSLLLDPPVLILDEPSNSMDEITEAHLRSNLMEYVTDKTLLLITHRGSMLTLVNRLILMDSGKVIADGPKELVLKHLAEGKIYAAKAQTSTTAPASENPRA